MDGASLAQAVIGQEHTGSILPGFERVFIFKEATPDLAVADPEIPGHTVDILRVKQQGGAGEPVATVGRAKITVGFIAR